MLTTNRELYGGEHPVCAVIDAGHGGQHRAGASTPLGVCGSDGTVEKDITLDVARRVAHHLRGRALLTRDDDRNLSLAQRARVAQRSQAPVFVSLHANAGPPDRRGAETYLHQRAGVSSGMLATALNRRLGNVGQAERVPLRANLGLLSPERLPRGTAACLVELDYLSQPAGERHLRDPGAREQLAIAIARGIDDYLRPPRYGDATSTDSEGSATAAADPGQVAQQLLSQYLKPYLTRLSDEAKSRLVQAWREAPAGVIAAGTILGAAGVAYLAGTKSALPSLPAIPLDVLGGVFQGAELRLQLNGPVTNPESFQFSVTFRDSVPRRPQADRPAPAVVIDELLPEGSSPEQIAARVDGPEFETEVPGEGPSSDIALYLGEFVRGIGNHLVSEIENDSARPWLDLGQLPRLPGDFGRALERIVDELVDALPDRFGSIEQVNFVTHYGEEVRWIPARPRARRQSAGGLEVGADQSGLRVGQCVLEVTAPAVLPPHDSTPSPFHINNTYSVESRVLFDNDKVILEFENTVDQDVNCRVKISDDEGNGLLCEADIDIIGIGSKYLQFSRFPLRADQVSPMRSCRYEVFVTNLRRASEGVELWLTVYT